MIRPEVIIGTDFSEQSTIAIETGLNWAKYLHCDASVVHINTSRHSNEALGFLTAQNDQRLDELITGLKSHLAERLHDQVKPFLAQYQLKDQIIHFGPKIESLQELVKKRLGKIVVLGSLSHRQLENFFVGSTTINALRELPCPVLAVKDRQSISPQQITLLTDLKDVSQFAFDWAKLLAASFQAEIEIVHGHKTDDPDQEELAKEKLQAMQLELQREGLSARFTIIPINENRAEKVLLKYCSENRSDLFVMGTQGKKGLQRFVLGSVAEYLIQHLPHSLFLVKNPV